MAQIVAAGLLPVAMEIMDALAIEAAEAVGASRSTRKGAALLIVELEGERDVVDARRRAARRRCCAQSGATRGARRPRTPTSGR